MFKSIRLGCLSFLVFCMKQFIPKLAAESRMYAEERLKADILQEAMAIKW